MANTKPSLYRLMGCFMFKCVPKYYIQTVLICFLCVINAEVRTWFIKGFAKSVLPSNSMVLYVSDVLSKERNSVRTLCDIFWLRLTCLYVYYIWVFRSNYVSCYLLCFVNVCKPMWRMTLWKINELLIFSPFHVCKCGCWQNIKMTQYKAIQCNTTANLNKKQLKAECMTELFNSTVSTTECKLCKELYCPLFLGQRHAAKGQL